MLCCVSAIGDIQRGILGWTPILSKYEGALAAGLEVGVYFFSQAVTVEEALEEARFVLDCIAGYDISFPVVFDWSRSQVIMRVQRPFNTGTLRCGKCFLLRNRSCGLYADDLFNLFAGYIKYRSFSGHGI